MRGVHHSKSIAELVISEALAGSAARLEGAGVAAPYLVASIEALGFAGFEVRDLLSLQSLNMPPSMIKRQNDPCLSSGQHHQAFAPATSEQQALITS